MSNRPYGETGQQENNYSFSSESTVGQKCQVSERNYGIDSLQVSN